MDCGHAMRIRISEWQLIWIRERSKERDVKERWWIKQLSPRNDLALRGNGGG
jgi:hypothetical protein